MTALGIVSLPVFLGLTVVLVGFAAYMTGQAVANTWQPAWKVVVYCLLLGLVDRFLGFALFGGLLLSPLGYLIDTAVLTVIGLFAYRFTRAYRMVHQYPWLYERAGLFGWRDKDGGGAA
jgi:hypothetical protein